MAYDLRLRSFLIMSVSALAVTAVSTPTFAQDAAPAKSNSIIEELVVTAQKREEAIQDVPIAVSAFSQDSLEKAKIDGGPNLQLAIPNVAFSKGNFSGFNFQIRGIGAKLVAASGDAGTGIHLNNAPLTASNLFEAEFYDVERVEVLRGPQGTLYGRNATGGVVNVITAKPVDHFTANIKGEVGNYETRKLRGMVNIPLGEMFSARVAGAYLKRGGFGTNITTGNKIDDRDLSSIRGTIAFNPTSTFSSSLMWEHFEEDDNRSRVGKQFCVKDNGPEGLNYSSNAATAGIQRGILSQGCKNASVYAAGSLGTPNTMGTFPGTFSHLLGLQLGDMNAGKVQDQNVRNIEGVVDPTYKAKTDVGMLAMAWEVTDNLKLSALSSYSKGEVESLSDYNRIVPGLAFNVTPLTPGGILNDPQIGPANRQVTMDISSASSEQWSHELRLQSSYAGKFNFNVGLITLDYESMSDYYVFGNSITAAANVLINGGKPCPINTPTCAYIDPAKTPSGVGHNYFDSRSPYRLKSDAAFGEVYYQLTDDFKLTGGLRYTHDSKKQENRPAQLLTPGSGLPLNAALPILTADFKELTGRAGFDWKPDLALTDSTLLYAFYSRGYKGGGMNPPQSAGAGLAPQNSTFAPEFVNAFEVGMKNVMLDGSLVLNATAFYYDYKGYQVSKIVNRSSLNENLDAKITGLEIESIWEPVRNLRFNANIGLLSTEIGAGKSVDLSDLSQGDPNYVTARSATTLTNCRVSKAGVAAVLAYVNANNLPANTLYGICGGSFAAFGAVPLPGIEANLKGNELPNAPKATVSIGAQYKWELAGGWDATLRGDYYQQGDSYSRAFNSEADRLKGWANLNATVQIVNAEKGLQIEGYVKNALDKAAITDLYLTDDSSALFKNAFFVEPRTYGISIQKSF